MIPSKRVFGVVLCLFTLTFGFMLSVLGPSLPDLQCLYGVDLQTISYLFIFFCLGGVVSQTASGFILDRVSSPFPYLSGCSLIFCLSYILLPFAQGIYAAAIVQFFAAGALGSGMCGVLYILQKIWPGNGRMVHLVFTLSSVGSLLGPLVLNPFLSDGILTKLYMYQAEDTENITGPNSNWTFFHYTEELKKPEFAQGNLSLPSDCSDFKSLIHYPYIIYGITGIPVLMTFLIFTLRVNFDDVCTPYEKLPEGQKRPQSTIIYLVLMMFYFVQSQGLPSGLSALLTTFGIKSFLQLSLNEMSLMTSFFWSVFMIGRLLVIILPADFKQVYLIGGCMVGSSVGMVFLICTIIGGRVILWIACLILGLFSAPFASAGIAWSHQIISVTPNINSLYMGAIFLGIALPYPCGYIMAQFGPLTFIYFFVVFQVFNIIIFICVNIYIRYGFSGRS